MGVENDKEGITPRQSIRHRKQQDTERLTDPAVAKLKKTGIWVALGLLVLAGLTVLFSLRSLFVRSSGPADARDNGAIISGTADDESADEDVIRTFQMEAKKCAADFFAASSLEEMISLVAEPERVGPLMKDYYQKRPLPSASSRFVSLLGTDYHVADGRRFVIGRVNYEEIAPAMAVFEKKGEKLLLHWEVLVGHSAMDWDEFREKRPKKPTRFRVSLLPSDYYNYEFARDSELQSFTLTHPYSSHRIYGYMRKDSGAWSRYINVANVARKVGLPVIVDLSFPVKDSGDDQVWIDDIRQFSWVEGVDM